jgi:hypothetical protein
MNPLHRMDQSIHRPLPVCQICKLQMKPRRRAGASIELLVFQDAIEVFSMNSGEAD